MGARKDGACIIREENERRATLKVKVTGRMNINRAASYLQAFKVKKESEEVPPQNSDKEKNQLRLTGLIITITSPAPKIESCLRRDYLTLFSGG